MALDFSRSIEERETSEALSRSIEELKEVETPTKSSKQLMYDRYGININGVYSLFFDALFKTIVRKKYVEEKQQKYHTRGSYSCPFDLKADYFLCDQVISNCKMIIEITDCDILLKKYHPRVTTRSEKKKIIVNYKNEASDLVSNIYTTAENGIKRWTDYLFIDETFTQLEIIHNVEKSRGFRFNIFGLSIGNRRGGFVSGKYTFDYPLGVTYKDVIEKLMINAWIHQNGKYEMIQIEFRDSTVSVTESYVERTFALFP